MAVLLEQQPKTVQPPHSSTHFLGSECKALVAKLLQDLDGARAALAQAEQESAAWNRLDGTPRVNDATKNRHIKPHLVHWQQRVTELKSAIRDYETDIAGLSLLI